MTTFLIFKSCTLSEFDQDMPVQEGDILIPVRWRGFIFIFCVALLIAVCLNLQENRNAVQTLWPDATTPYIITDELGRLLSLK